MPSGGDAKSRLADVAKDALKEALVCAAAGVYGALREDAMCLDTGSWHWAAGMPARVAATCCPVIPGHRLLQPPTHHPHACPERR